MGASYSAAALADSKYAMPLPPADHAKFFDLCRLHMENHGVTQADAIRNEIKQQVEAHHSVGTQVNQRWRRGIEQMCAIIQGNDKFESPINVHYQRQAQHYEYMARLDGEDDNAFGGNSAVYSVRLIDDGKTKSSAATHAIKILYNWDEVPTQQLYMRHINEWNIAGDNGKRLPGVANIQPVYHYFIDRLPSGLPGHPVELPVGSLVAFVVMDLRRMSLQALLNERNATTPQALLTPMELLMIASPIARSIATLWNSGVLVPDIKPSNILLSSTGSSLDLSRCNPSITGFGRAFDLVSDQNLDRSLPANTQLTGSQAYMAPEIRKEQKEPTNVSRSMVYSFGRLLVSCMDQRAGGLVPVTDIAQLSDGYPVSLRQLAIDCLQVSADRRLTHEQVIHRLDTVYDDIVSTNYVKDAGCGQINTLLSLHNTKSPLSPMTPVPLSPALTPLATTPLSSFTSSGTTVASSSRQSFSTSKPKYGPQPMAVASPTSSSSSSLSSSQQSPTSLSTVGAAFITTSSGSGSTGTKSEPEEPPSLGGEELQLYVKKGNTVLNVSTTSNALIRHVKMKIYKEHRDWPIDDQKLVFAGRALDDHHSIHDCNIPQLSSLFLVRNQTKLPPPPAAAATGSSTPTSKAAVQQSSLNTPPILARAESTSSQPDRSLQLPSPTSSLTSSDYDSKRSPLPATYSTSQGALIAAISCMDAALTDILKDHAKRSDAFQAKLSSDYIVWETSIRKQMDMLSHPDEIAELDRMLTHERKVRNDANNAAYHAWGARQAAQATRLVAQAKIDIAALHIRLGMESPGIWLQVITDWMDRQMTLRHRILRAECVAMTQRLTIEASSRLGLDPFYSQLVMFVPQGADDRIPPPNTEPFIPIQTSTSSSPLTTTTVAPAIPVPTSTSSSASTPPRAIPGSAATIGLATILDIAPKPSTPTDASSQMINIKYGNRVVTVYASPNERVCVVKQRITEIIPDLLPHHQRLVYAGRAWDDNVVLADYSVATTSTITLTRVIPSSHGDTKQSATSTVPTVVSTRPKLELTIRQNVMGGRMKSHQLHIHDDATIKMVKMELQQLTGIPYTEQNLIFAGRALDDHRTIMEYHVSQQSVIHLVLRSQHPHNQVPAIGVNGITPSSPSSSPAVPAKVTTPATPTATSRGESKETKQDVVSSPAVAVTTSPSDVNRAHSYSSSSIDSNKSENVSDVMLWSLLNIQLSGAHSTPVSRSYGIPHILARNVPVITTQSPSSPVPVRFTLSQRVSWTKPDCDRTIIIIAKMLQLIQNDFKDSITPILTFVSIEDCDSRLPCGTALRTLCHRDYVPLILKNVDKLIALDDPRYGFPIHSIIIGDWSIGVTPANIDMRGCKMYNKDHSSNIWRGAYKLGGEKGANNKLATRELPYFCPLSWYMLSLISSVKPNDRWYTGYVGMNQSGALMVLNTYRSSTVSPFPIDIMISPSIEYAAHPSTCGVWRMDGRWIQVLLQVRVRPTAIVHITSDTITGSTTTMIDSNFAINVDENKSKGIAAAIKSGPLEWHITPAVGRSLANDIICCGIMIRLLPKEMSPNSLQSSQWWRVGAKAASAADSSKR